MRWNLEVTVYLTTGGTATCKIESSGESGPSHMDMYLADLKKPGEFFGCGTQEDSLSVKKNAILGFRIKQLSTSTP